MSDKIAFIDIFTTQNDLFGKNNCPIQFSYQVFDETEIYDDGKFILNPENTVTIKIIPDEDISIAGYIKSGINNEFVNSKEYNGIDLKSALETIYENLSQIKEDGFYIAGYNHMKYDLTILNNHFERILNKEKIVFPEDRIIDVMELSEYMIPVTKCGNYSMDSVFVYLFNDINKLESVNSVKSTLTDLRVTKMIMTNLLRRISKDRVFSCKDIVTIINKLKQKINRFNFGKYKGLTLDEVFQKDTSYISWVMKHSDKRYLVEKLRLLMDSQVQ